MAEKIRPEEGTVEEKASRLQLDILSIIDHIFGDHTKCAGRDFPCDGHESDKNWVPLLEKTGLYAQLNYEVEKLSARSRSLIINKITNIVENVNSVVAKLAAGKRINKAKRDNEYLIGLLAAVQHSTQRVLSQIFQAAEKQVPVVADVMETQRIRRNEYNAQKRAIDGRI